MTEMPMNERHSLRLAGVSLSLSQSQLFAPLEVSIAAGEIVTVMGESGSGKSSLLNFICGTLPKDMTSQGKVLLDEQEISHLAPEQRRVGILFQDDLLFPHLSVAENLAFGLPRAIQGQQRWEQVSAALNRAGLTGLGRRDPATLSGGQRARAALMRTLLSQPRCLLLDEPFSKLDTALRERIRRFVFEHARQAALPTLLVSHDPEDAAAAGGQVVHLHPQLPPDNETI